MKKFILIAALAVSGCVSAPQIQMLMPVQLTESQSEQVKAAVIAKLKDPGSADFGNMKAGKDMSGKIFVCGHVNAKNSYGGFTGMTPFGGDFTPSGSFLVGGIGGVPAVSTAIYQVCNKQGLHI
ncbi:hypothetical protein F9K98_13270 [Brucella anthropi]|uniref:hypothetical protein n=1 Tax=Brucella anthropi TaxID=529 RepID=UPI00124F27F6|nr:hypothetical protein [Brucella anthropi]KAB2762759.1 hypothetical protein F9K98_13270 [Brucella anthropi]